MAEWKEIAYSSYVSSGQAEDKGSPAQQFRGRRSYLDAIIRAHFPANHSARILDVGCGHGALLYFLRQHGYSNVRGVDGSHEQVALAQRMGIDGVELGDAISFLRAQPAASADVICMFDVLEHQSRQEAFDVLAEVKRVLIADARCIGHTPNAEGIFGSKIRYADLTHEQAFTPSSVRQLFRASGFASVRCFEDKPAPHGIKSLVRRVLWEIGTIPFRVLHAAETGTRDVVLSQNLLFVARTQK